jgi:hypothetical protein
MFRFTIRDWLWLMTVVALAMGWSLDHRQFEANDRAMMRSFKKQMNEGKQWLEYPQLTPDAEPT